MNKPSITDKNSEEEKYQEKISSYIKREVNELLEDGSIPVRIAVYDFLSGKFKGYKVDSFWTTHKKFLKIHPLKDAQPSGHLIENLLYCLKEYSELKEDTQSSGNLLKDLLYWFRKPKSNDLDVVVEEIDSEGNLKAVKNRYHVYFSFGKYRAKKTYAAKKNVLISDFE
jgi:hypothetical protein